MPSYRIQADYSQLASAVRVFQQYASHLSDLYNQSKRQSGYLMAGDWIGQGAERFGREMDELVFPALCRLIVALQEGGDSLTKIIRLFQQAEAEAGRLFVGADGSRANAMRLGPEAIGFLKRMGYDPTNEEHQYDALGLDDSMVQLPTDTVKINGKDIGLFAGIGKWNIRTPVASIDWPPDRMKVTKDVLDDAPAILHQNSIVKKFFWTGEKAQWLDKQSYGIAAGVFLPDGDQGSIYTSGTIILSEDLGGAKRYGGDSLNSFRAGVLHEFTHSAQYQESGEYSKLLTDYAQAFNWTRSPLDKKWTFSGDKADLPGGNDQSTWYPSLNEQNPLEDMAEAVAFYRYNPDTFFKNSPARYDWVKTNIYNGKEFRTSNTN